MPLIDLRDQAGRRSPEDLVRHLDSFELELKFSAGVWFFSPPDSRFHGKYKPDLDLEQRLEIAAGHRGWLEAYLIRRRAPASTVLPPIDDAVRTTTK